MKTYAAMIFASSSTMLSVACTAAHWEPEPGPISGDAGRPDAATVDKDSSPPDAASLDKDGSCPDSSTDAATTSDAADGSDTADSSDVGVVTKDSGVDASACPPASVASFTPTWHSPRALHASACTATQVEAIVDCWFDSNSDPATCDVILKDSANAGCSACLMTDVASAQYGPLMLRDNLVASLNEAASTRL